MRRTHASLEVSYGGRRVMVDCGADWRGRLDELRPRAIIITHAHPDHVHGLADGAPCPVYATEATWETVASYPVSDRRTIRPREPVEIQGIGFEAFTVEHSLRAPS